MKVVGWIATNKVGSKAKFEVEIPDEELEELDSEEARQSLIEDYVRDVMWDHAEWGWE